MFPAIRTKGDTEFMIHFLYLPGNGTVRLSEATRRLAERYLESDEIAKTAIGENFSFVPDPARGVFANYAENIRLIAEHAPLRILPEEKLVGAATYRSAVWHGTPGHVYNGISHTTVHFEKGIRLGLSGLEREVRESMRRPGRTSGELEFLESMLTCIEAMRIWHRRYQAELKRMAGMEEISSVLEKVPEGGAETFREAVQSLAFFYEFCRLCGNWSGLGRLDRMLRGYLEQDLRANRITLEEARELLAHFWIKGTEWKGLQKGSGDAQHYQNVILGGIDASGRDVTNPVTHLILDIVEELHISDFPIAVRVNGQTSDAMFARIAEIQRRGGGIVSIYNEFVVLKALEKFGYPYEEAVEFTNDGCWEVIIPGRTFFGYRPFDALRIFQEFLFRSPESSSFEDFYGLYLEELRAYIRNLDSKIASAFSRGEGNFGTPGSLLSLFVENCIGSARNYGAGGPVYTAIATHAGGLPDVANELFLLKKLVFEEKRLTLEQVVDLLRRNWEGEELLRNEIRAGYRLYGNDSAEADAVLKRLVEDYAGIAGETRKSGGVLRPAGISTFGRELEFASGRKATLSGRFAGEVLAANLAPSPGTDLEGPTAVVKSFCKVDFTKIPNGCPLDLKFHASALSGADGVEKLAALLKTFIVLGGFYLQVDAVDPEMLRDAQAHPERYPNLSVRISGWSARFVTLSPEWQEMVIRRTEQRF